MRTSPVHYIAPSAISIVPNCNGSASDLAVNISRGAKIKVYSPRAGIDKTTDGEYQEWTITGRNRRLADSTKPYTIYARLSALDNTAYLIFAPMTPDDDGEYLGAWTQAYSWITTDGLYVFGKGSDWEEQRTKMNCIFVRLGDVSLPDANNQRTVTLDTGILGTDQFNDEWALRPDELPLRIEIGCTINDEDVGQTPYVYWGQELVLTAMLTEGWTGTDIQRFDHWEIRRDSGDTEADAAWAEAASAGEFRSTGVINLVHGRGAETRDDFNSVVNATFTVMAMERTDDPEAGGEPEYAILKQASFCIMAEVWEDYQLSADTLMVTFNPRNGQYSPSGNIKFRIRATDQKSDVFMMTYGQYADAGLHAEYAPVDDSQNWTPITISGTESATAEGEVPATAFSTHQKSINVRLKNAVGKELDRFTIAFLKDGEDSREREWIYRLDTAAGYSNTTGTIGGDPSHPVSGQTGGVDNCRLVDDFVPENWTDEPTGTSSSHATEYASYRDYDYDNDRWGAFNTPKPWSHYGQDGDDGLYYKNEYARSKSRTSHAAADIDTSYGTSGWGTVAPSATETYPYIWKRTRQWNPNTNDWATGSSWTYVCETGDDGPAGSNGDTPMQAFQWNQNPTSWPTPKPTDGTLGDWSPTAPNRPSGTGDYYLWMTQTVKHISANGTVTYDTWSDPVRISGNNGTNGEDGTDYEYIYILKTAQYTFPTNEKPANISTGEVSPGGHAASGSETDKQKDDWVPNGWWDNPQGIDSTNKFEYMSLRTKPKGSNTWGAFSDPFIWSHWGRNGMDGDGMEYVYMRTKNNVKPIVAYNDNINRTAHGKTYLDDEYLPVINNNDATKSDATKAWAESNECTDDPKGISRDWPYEWCLKRVMTPVNAETGKRTWRCYGGTAAGQTQEMDLWNHYAENAIRLDLDNEMDSVQTDSQGKILSAREVSTVIRLWDGATEVDISAVDFTASGRISGSPASTVATFSQAASGKGKQLKWTFIAEQSMPTAYEITISYVYLNETHRCTLTIAASMGQPVYQLKPSRSSLPCTVNSSNTYNNPPALSLSVVKVDGASTDEITTIGSGGTIESGMIFIRYSLDSMPTGKTAGSAWPTANSVQATSDKENVYIAMFNAAGTLLDRETIPIIKDGKNGKNSVRLALDNEHEDFLYNDAGTLIAPSGGAKSVIRLYDGPNEVSLATSMLSIDSSSSGVPTTGDNVPTIITDTDGKIKLKVPHITSGTAKVVVKCTHNGHDYFTEFTGNKTSQDKYDLYVRPNAIPYNPASYTPMTLAFEAERTDLQGNKTSATISTSGSGKYAAGNLYLFFGYVKADGSIVNPTGQPTPLYEWADIPVAASVCNTYVGIYFELRYYLTSSTYRKCDHETVEIAKSLNAPYYVVDYGRASSRSLNQQGTPSGFDSPTGWQSTAPATSDDFPYIWERSRHYDSAGTLQSTSYTCLTGATGLQGDDGISVFTDPTNILIRQVAKPQGNNNTDFGLPMDVGFAVKEGKTDGTVTDVYIQSASGLTVIKKESDHTKAQITDVVPTGTAYPTKGYFTCRVSYTINGTSKQVDVKVPVYIDPIGSIVTTIEGDVEQTVAHDIGYAIDPSGGVQSLAKVGTYIRSASEMTSEISKKVGAGKNLLTGVLTGEGWQLLRNGTRTNIETNDEDKFVIPSGYYLESPDHNYSLNDGYYALSYEAPAHATIGFYDVDNNPIDVPRTRGYVNGRRYIIFNTVWEDEGEEKSLDTDVVIRFSGVSYIRHPQLETGEVATAFEASTSETSSRIHQTAEQIEELVNDTGVNIVDKTIDLYADKVKFYKNKSAAQAGDPAKIWIDGGDGSLHAVDGHFEGTVRANNFYQQMSVFYEGNSLHDSQYSYCKYYCTDAYDTFQQGYYYDPSVVPVQWYYNFIPCTYDAEVVNLIPNPTEQWNSGKNTCYLPDPEDFVGKVVHVYAPKIGSITSCPIIDCVVRLIDQNDRRFAKWIYLDDNNRIKAQVLDPSDTVALGTEAIYQAIYADGDGEYYWLKLL